MSTAPPSQRALSAPTLVLAAAAVLVGGWLRVRALDAPYSPDEFANVHSGGLFAIWMDAESGVNPPLTRWLGNLFVPDRWSIITGRLVSVVASTAALPIAFLVAVRASRSEFAALAATTLLAVAPVMVTTGGWFRSYALWSLAFGVHLLCVSALAEGDRSPEAPRRWAAMSAAVMVWTHYLTIPLALLWAPLLQWTGLVPRAMRLWLPAAVSIAPMALLVFGVTEARVATSSGVLEGLADIVSGGFPGKPSPGWWSAVVSGLPGDLWRDHLSSVVLTAPLLLVPLVWRRLPPTARVAAVGLLALLGSVLAVGLFQFVRSPVGVMWFSLLAPVLARLLALPRWSLLRIGFVVAAGGLLGRGRGGELDRARWSPPEIGLQRIVDQWPRHAGLSPGDRIWVSPGWAWTGSHLLLVGTSARHAEASPRCEGDRCYEHQGVLVELGSTRVPGTPGVFLAVEHEPAPQTVEDCALVERRRDLSVWTCPR